MLDKIKCRKWHVCFGFALVTAMSLFAMDSKNMADESPPVAVVAKLEPKTAEEIPRWCQDISVTIHAGNAQGSGVIVTRKDENYVLTAAHVISDLRKTRSVVDPKTGATKIKIEFDDAKVVKEIYDDDFRSVGRLIMDAEVIRYSNADNGEDLALLRLRKKNFIKVGAVFDAGKTSQVGTQLWHVGSLLGQTGSNSVTPGVVSQQGRVLNGTIYDQSTCAAFPGSSGGGLYLTTNGKYVGMIVRGAGETFNLYIPIRRIRQWADRVDVSFILDTNLPVPSYKDLRKTPVEEVGGSENDAPPKGDNKIRSMPFLIERTGQN